MFLSYLREGPHDSAEIRQSLPRTTPKNKQFSNLAIQTSSFISGPFLECPSRRGLLQAPPRRSPHKLSHHPETSKPGRWSSGTCFRLPSRSVSKSQAERRPRHLLGLRLARSALGSCMRFCMDYGVCRDFCVYGVQIAFLRAQAFGLSGFEAAGPLLLTDSERLKRSGAGTKLRIQISRACACLLRSRKIALLLKTDCSKIGAIADQGPKPTQTPYRNHQQPGRGAARNSKGTQLLVPELPEGVLRVAGFWLPEVRAARTWGGASFRR